MGKAPKFSIIIPAHNSSAYIMKGLESIRKQSFRDYELIVVCDSCTDNTMKIVKKYTSDVFVTDFHQDGQARNVGLDHATGDWILFMDDDDWLLHEFVLAQLNDFVGRQNEDVVAFSFIWKGVGYTQNTPDNTYIATWNKCWKRVCIGDVRFSDAPRTSDVAFHEGMMRKKPKIVYWNMPMYYYNWMRAGSQTELHVHENNREITRLDILNKYISERGYKSFLEIGTGNGYVFNNIKAERKESIDPDEATNATKYMTSDEYFNVTKDSFDIVFIDGFHECNQAYRDIMNAFGVLNIGGMIVVHDCHPTDRKMQEPFSGQYEWTGDVWKAFVKARARLPYEMFVLDYDYGCGIIDTVTMKQSDTSLLPTDMDIMTYEDFVNHPEWMNYKKEF